MTVCPQCGQENPGGARFCFSCGTELSAEAAREERKIVSVLFADLVGFTSRAEQLDPEDVRAISSRITRVCAPSSSARWDGREVHRRRGDGALRRADGARGRP